MSTTKDIREAVEAELKFDPLVDDVEGVAAFMSDATTGPITFI